MICAVIDTNVLVSALLSRNGGAATVKVIHAVLSGKITPLYHQEIIEEYEEVLARPKFHFNKEDISILISAFKQFGIEFFRNRQVKS